MPAKVYPHIERRSFPRTLAWCGVTLIDWYLVGGEWRFVSIESAIDSAKVPGAARPCPACVAAVTEALNAITPYELDTHG